MSFKRSTTLLLAVILGWLGMSFSLIAASRAPVGKDIYRKQCASCHGKAGEGVSGKYDDPLHGDWSVERLSRYIHRTMPEDKPKSLAPPEADAVAKFIHDEFYSLEARLRNNPPRLELARLTNRQFVNSVADLLRSFVEPNGAPKQERGLRGSYRGGGRRGDNEVKPFDRVDSVVAFDFLSEQADPQVGKTNALNVTWRGAIIAEETGDYEFIIKTPNGARLWVNTEDDNATIDAGVSSGVVDEHKTTVRLIGGRVYPIRLEWFKNQRDKLASIELRWVPPHGAPELIPARCLAPINVSPTFVLSVAFPADDLSAGYERGVQISKAWDEAATQASIATANYVAAHLDPLAGTKREAPDRVAKITTFSEAFVSRAFRRPLTADEKRTHVTAHFSAKVKPEDSVKRVVLLTLKSPRFLFPDLPVAKPDDFATASRLALGMWDSLPDRELTKLAGEGALKTPEQVRAQSERMLKDFRARTKMQQFLHHWLQLDRVETVDKDMTLFPGFTPEVIADLRTSLNLFLDDVVWGAQPDYRRLLQEDDFYVNGRLAEFYGMKTNAGSDFVKISFSDEPRAGIITHPYLLAAFSYAKSTSPIHRGVFLTRNVVGRALRPPAEAVAFKEDDFPADLTMREKITVLTRSDNCQSCHSVINPLGFSLENYDALGRYRTQDAGKPVDAVSEYQTDDGKTVRLTGARDIAEFALGSEHGQQVFVDQLFHHIVKQSAMAYGPAVMKRLRETFVSSGFNIQKLVVEIAAFTATSPAQIVKKN